PKKTNYIAGEKFDPTGLVITLTYNNGKTEDVAYSDSTKDGFTFAPKTLAVGDKNVTITYGGKSTKQAITVADKQLSSIAVKTAPRKTNYIDGEKFDPTGLVITLTYNNGKTEDVAYCDSTKDGFTFAPETLAVGDKEVTITYGGKSTKQAVKVSAKSSGGSSGGGGGSRPTTPTEPMKPSISDIEMSWSEIADYLTKLSNGTEVTIKLNGNTTVPVEVIKVIDDRKLKVTFVYDSAKSWKTDGAEITTPAAADLSILATSKLKTDVLRGVSGLQFTMNNTNIPTVLSVAFKAAHAGKFANLYKNVSGKLEFVTCAKLDKDGKVILPKVIEKGDYVAMLCEFSDLKGDMNNDGVMSAADASEILKHTIGAANGVNPAVADMNGEGKITAADAAEILKRIVGLA
ncbi:MAG: bacterial Ig-like domain-containing protein, partial [Oscillospiraceae bacterium]